MKPRPDNTVVHYPFKRAVSSATVLSLLGVLSTAWAQSYVGPTDLGTLGGSKSAALVISADGKVVAGYAYDAANNQIAASWVNGVTSPSGLATLGGNSSSARGLSPDGQIIVGYSANAAGYARAVSWTNGVISDLGTLGGNESVAHAISADGKTIVGAAYDATNTSYAVSWSNGATTPTNLGSLAVGAIATADDVSADGKVIVGSSHTVTTKIHAVSWTNGATTPTDLGTLGGDYSAANKVSADGKVIIGFAQSGTGSFSAASWINGSSTATDLGTLGGYSANAYGVSSDGSVIVGYADIPSGESHAAAWFNGSTTATDLGTLGGTYSQANTVSLNGKVIVGYADNPANETHAAAWINGAVSATDLGVLGGTYSRANAVSADGSIIVGELATAAGDRHAALWKLGSGGYTGIDVNNTVVTVAKSAYQTFSIMELQRLALGRLQIFCDAGKAGNTCYTLSTDGVGFGAQKDWMARATMAHALTDHFSLGASIAYSLWRDLPGYFQHNSNNYGAGVFAQWKDQTVTDPWYLRASLAGNQYEIDRTRAVMGGTEAGTGSNSIRGWSGSLELGKSLTLPGKDVIGYYAGLRYTDLKAKGYTEQQASFPFTYTATKYNMSTAYLGASYTQALSSKLKWSVNAELEHDYRHQDPRLTASEQTVGTFNFRSNLQHTRLSASTTLSYLLANGLTLSATPFVTQTATRDTAVGAMLALSGKF